MRNARSLAFIVSLALLSGLGAFVLSRIHRPEPTALGIAPERAAFIVEVNIHALRQADWITRNASGNGAWQRLRAQCGEEIDHIEFMRGYVLADAAGQLNDVAVSAHGPFEIEALTRCVAHANDEMGTALHETEIEGTPVLASDQGSSVAAPLGAHGVMTGPVNAVASSLRALRGDANAVAPELATLWESLQTRRDVRIVGTLPEGWRSFFSQLPRGDAHRPEHIAIGISLAHGLDAEASLTMPNESDASALRAAADRQLAVWREQEAWMQSALRAPLLQTETRTEGATLLVSLRLSETETLDALALARMLIE